ncbi:unnamed protein product, partial [Iphiclides podalirius]
MDELAKHSASYQLDQEILDARGIDMKVDEVAGLPTCKYSERVQALHLGEDDLAFLKGLRRRIKNRLASQNSRRRSMEHLRKLARELRAVRQCRDDALSERRGLLARRDAIRDQCVRLRRHLVQILRGRFDSTTVPEEELENMSTTGPAIEPTTRKITETEPVLMGKTKANRVKGYRAMERNGGALVEELEKDIKIFECRIDKLVQQSVNHMYKDKERRRICAKTIFITDKGALSDGGDDAISEGGVLNLSVREGRRKSHGRKQSAPRRITYVYSDTDDGVLDLKIKKEPQ